MAQRCKPCEQFANKQTTLLERRVLLWRRGMLTDDISEKLDLERHRLTEDLERHQEAYHQPSAYS